ncbi:MAG: hypothetical protein ACYS76_06895 [Planctomycetota bacterium]|jgi:hypothetical protein
MNLSKLYPFFLAVCIAVGLLVSKWVGASLVAGASFGLLAGLIPMLVFAVVYAAIMFWRPDLPTCRCGQTKYGDYEYVGPMEGFSEDTWYENRCPKCGRHYKSKGKVVMECQADGTLIPYMRVSKWGRWQLDNAEPDTAVDADKPRR